MEAHTEWFKVETVQKDVIELEPTDMQPGATLDSTDMDTTELQSDL